MNLQELDNPTSTDPDRRVPAFDLHTGLADRLQHPQKASSLSSTPSESDWVSPFTLPPLPAFRRTRGRNPESPEHLKQRGGSGAYYAAAWGSPYASPSPESRSAQYRAGRRSIDSELSSPPQLQHSPLASAQRKNRHSIDTGDVASPEARIRLIRVRKLQEDTSERSHWLSDSEDSGREADFQQDDYTPRGGRVLATWGASPIHKANQKRHTANESVDTVTPENFKPAFATNPRQSSRRVHSFGMALVEEGEPGPAIESPLFEYKPLPEVPEGYDPKKTNSPKKMEPQISPTRPRPNTMQSFQRPKKKVPWKGKTCVIALPLTDRESAGLPPVLTHHEVKERIDALVASGYTTKGFELTDFVEDSSGFGSGHSRPIYPDPQDLHSERQMHRYQVHIPNQDDWNQWVQWLQEEKLRALGVTPSSSEPPASTTSPFSASLSRTSSRYVPLVGSPSMPTSPNSNALRATSNPFSPAFSASSGMGSQIGSGSSSQYNGFPIPSHGHKQSVAIPTGRGASPRSFSPLQPGQFSPVIHSPVDGHGRQHTGFSPINPQGMQSLGEVLSPPSNPPSAGPSPNIAPETTDYMSVPRNPQQPRSASHEPRPSTLSRPSLLHQSSSVPRTPNYDNSSRPPVEIQHPTPRSHRHNLSAALQKEIDEAEAALEFQRDSVDLSREVLAKGGIDENEAGPEDSQAELPILKRPETFGGADDRSDIETNPSIAASPLLMDEQNPFANWQALSDAARGDAAPADVERAEPPREASKKPGLASMMSYKGHKAQPSLSKLNVEAKEFNPGGGFDSSNFSVAEFNPFAAPARAPLSLVRKDTALREVSGSQLNVEAPAFNPSAASFNPIVTAFTPVEKSVEKAPTPAFRVPSSAFNVEAPEFDPNKSPPKKFGGSTESTSESEPKSTSIFGKITIEPDTKVSRRTIKALPIVRPRSKDSPSNESSGEESSLDVEEDETGRPSAPTDRAKRARRIGSDGEQSPLYADSAPFNHNHTRILSEIVDKADSEKSFDEKPREKPVDGWSYIPAGEPEPVAHGTISPLPERSIEMAAQTSPFEFRSHEDAIKFSEARPRAYSETSDEAEKLKDDAEEREAVSAASSSPLKQSMSSHKSKFSLSAKAEPFTFDSPQSSNQAQSPPAHLSTPPKQRKVTGLGASRWAASPSPPTSPKPVATARMSSPPAQPELAVKVEDDSDTENVKVSESIDESVGSSVLVQDEDRVDEIHSVQSHDFAEQVLDDPPSLLSEAGDDAVPSFEEIDAVMQHLDRNPELGIEREDSPFLSTPLIDMRLGPNFRSDAPSPSPRRRPEQPESRNDAASAAAFGLGIGVQRLGTGKEEVSDWNDAISTTEEDKFQSRTQFFDGHVNNLVDGVLENRLGPLERTLQTIQHSIALMATKPQHKERRSLSTDAKESDADDEDDYNAFEGFSSYRSRSPDAKRNNRRTSRIRSAVAEGMAAYRETIPQQPEVDLSQVLSELAGMRQQLQDRPQAPPHDQQKSMKAALDEVISNHPRLRGSRVQQDHESGSSIHQIHVDGLNAMLKAEQERADHETRLRKKADEEIELLKRALADAEADAAEHKEASDAAQSGLQAFVEEKEAYRGLEEDLDLVNRKNEELEMNLDEYRKYKVELQDDIDEERDKNVEMKKILQDVKERLDERHGTCKILKSKVEKLQDQISVTVRDLGSEQAQWRTRESELLTKMSIIENALDQATRQREKVEVDYHDIAKQYQEALLYKDRFDNLRHELTKSHETIANLQNESRHHQDTCFRLQKELDHITANKDAEVATAAARLTAELEGARSQLESFQTDSHARVARLQSRLDSAELDLEEQKAKHDTLISETGEANARTLQAAVDKHEAALEAQQASHQSHLTDLRERHTRAMHNSSDDKHRLEYQFNEKLSLSEDKTRHLEGKLIDLEERLEITKSAARAAVKAATAQGVNLPNLPTPANSVVASPPQRAASASLSLVKGSEIPERIPIQSLRESIMVLQDQLQNREQKIEKLEAELAVIDKEMPNKLKERETEATWLRELLAVRVDDIQDIIATLASPSFDKEQVKAAAIRLQANIQMEQQIKEHAAQTGGLTANLPLPSMSSLAAYAQSPRQSLPLAAAAAWGNFRKVRDMGGEKITEYLNQSAMATPSKSSIQGSPASLLSGIMTPPQTGARTPSVEREMGPPPSMRPLAAAAAARKAQGPTSATPDVQPRPLRGYSSKPRALGAKRETVIEQDAPLGAITRSPTSPLTPLPKRMSPLAVGGDSADDDLTGGFDDDASPLEGRQGKKMSVDEE